MCHFKQLSRYITHFTSSANIFVSITRHIYMSQKICNARCTFAKRCTLKEQKSPSWNHRRVLKEISLLFTSSQYIFRTYSKTFVHIVISWNFHDLGRNVQTEGVRDTRPTSFNRRQGVREWGRKETRVSPTIDYLSETRHLPLLEEILEGLRFQTTGTDPYTFRKSTADRRADDPVLIFGKG